MQTWKNYPQKLKCLFLLWPFLDDNQTTKVRFCICWFDALSLLKYRKQLLLCGCFDSGVERDLKARKPEKMWEESLLPERKSLTSSQWWQLSWQTEKPWTPGKTVLNNVLCCKTQQYKLWRPRSEFKSGLLENESWVISSVNSSVFSFICKKLENTKMHFFYVSSPWQ